MSSDAPADSPPDSMQCPSCGRYTGPLNRCRHCGARMPHRMSLRIFRWAAILLATVGLLLLYIMVRAREIPVVRVADISQTMNFAYVRVTGLVADDARIFRDGDRVEGMRFLVEDESGVLSVRVRGTQAEQLEREDRIPRAGDRVDVTGSLQVTADAVALWVQDTDALRIDREQVPRVALADVPWDEGRPVLVQARVTAIRPPPPDSRAPWEMVIGDDSGRAVLVVFDSVMREIPERNRPERGAWVEARVTPGSHRGRPQLRLGRGADVRVIAAPEVPVAPAEPPPDAEPVELRLVEEVARIATGVTVDWTARVVEVSAMPPGHRAPWRVMLADEQGASIPLVFWSRVAEGLGDNAPRVGDRIQIRARRDEYEGAMQLRLQRAEDLVLLDREDAP